MKRRTLDGPVVVVAEGGGLGTFVWGLLLGAGVALLFAPQSGEETRRMLRQRGRRLWSAAEEKAAELQGLVTEGFEDAKSTVEEVIDDRRHVVRDTIDAGRATAHSARDELEKRLAEARAARARARRAEPEPETPEA